MNALTIHKEAISNRLYEGDFDAAIDRAFALYPQKRAALELAYRTKDVNLFREICGLDAEFEQPKYIYHLPVQPAQSPVQYPDTEHINYAPLFKGVAALSGVAVIIAVAAKVVMVIITGAITGLSVAVARVAEYGFYIVVTIVVLYAVGFALRNKSASVGTEIAEKEEGIVVNVNIHSNNNKYGA